MFALSQNLLSHSKLFIQTEDRTPLLLLLLLLLQELLLLQSLQDVGKEEMRILQEIGKRIRPARSVRVRERRQSCGMLLLLLLLLEKVRCCER